MLEADRHEAKQFHRADRVSPVSPPLKSGLHEKFCTSKPGSFNGPGYPALSWRPCLQGSRLGLNVAMRTIVQVTFVSCKLCATVCRDGVESLRPGDLLTQWFMFSEIALVRPETPAIGR